MDKFHYSIFAFCFLFLSGCLTKNVPNDPNKDTGLPTSYSNKTPRSAKNVILLIGDGMGLSQISGAIYSSDKSLNIQRMPVVGLHDPKPAGALITDSAAGATSFASGIKTYNGAIGVNTDTVPTETILEEAEMKGLATGLIATSTIVHATPASFIAHQKSRKMYEEIAADFLKTDIDLFIGGGKKYFNRRTTDNRDLYAELRANNYFVSDYFEKDIQKIKIPSNQNFAYLTSDSDPVPFSQGRDYLVPATKKALPYLDKKNDNGFFLMIEGSQIDWGGHANNRDYVISELLEFDKVIGEVLDFAMKDKETLVVITADHETGGFSIIPGSNGKDLNVKFTSDYHTAMLIPVFAYGPGSERFSGFYPNTEIYTKMKEAFGWKKVQ